MEEKTNMPFYLFGKQIQIWTQVKVMRLIKLPPLCALTPAFHWTVFPSSPLMIICFAHLQATINYPSILSINGEHIFKRLLTGNRVKDETFQIRFASNDRLTCINCCWYIRYVPASASLLFDPASISPARLLIKLPLAKSCFWFEKNGYLKKVT